MLNELFQAKARKGEVKHLPNGFCLVVSEKPDSADGSLRNAFGEAPLTMTAMLLGETMLLSFVGMLRKSRTAKY